VKGWNVCRLHGAGGGHRPGPAHPSYRHGMRSQEWTEARTEVAELIRETRLIEQMVSGAGSD